jgi:fructose-specific phosphotransferase system IIA component
MNFAKFIRADAIVLNLKATDKQSVIEELLDVLVSRGQLAAADRQQALADLLKREKRMSTGMELGLAIPHAKTRVVDKLCVALGITEQGIEFESLDGQPAKVIFLVLSSLGSSGSHIECLAEVARAYSRAEVRKGLLKARTPAQVAHILTHPV